jgi:hypothetical protein
MTPEERTQAAIDQLQRMIDRLKTAGPGYTADVIGLHSVEDWMTQISIKATRARYSKSVEKTKDELIDVANYCALALSLIKDAEDMMPKPMCDPSVVIVKRSNGDPSG